MDEITLSLNLADTESAEEPKERIIDRELIIIGGGPAGLTAAIYGGRAQLKPLVLLGQAFGGQAATSNEMENYPGFADGINGMALAESIAKQAIKFGAELVYEVVTEIDETVYPYIVRTYGATYRTKAIILCTGAAPRKLGVPGESQFIGRGVSFCATCDGYFYRDRPIVVVGGGDSAIDEGLYLTRFASKVTVVHRRDTLRANALLQQRAFANPKMEFVWDSEVEEVLGNDTVTGIRVRNNKTDETQVIPADGIFVYIGFRPNVALIDGKLELTPDGYILTDKRQRTTLPGIYAAGDVQDPNFRQTVIAAGTGAAAAMEAERFIAEQQYQAEEKAAQAATTQNTASPEHLQ